jgi:hypothetical protein
MVLIKDANGSRGITSPPEAGQRVLGMSPANEERRELNKAIRAELPSRKADLSLSLSEQIVPGFRTRIWRQRRTQKSRCEHRLKFI